MDEDDFVFNINDLFMSESYNYVEELDDDDFIVGYEYVD